MQAVEELEKALGHLERAEGKLAQTEKSPAAWNALFMVTGVCEGIRVALRLLEQEKEE